MELTPDDILELRDFIRASGCDVVWHRGLAGIEGEVEVFGCDGTNRFADRWGELRNIPRRELHQLLDRLGTPCDCSVVMAAQDVAPLLQRIRPHGVEN